MLVEKTALPEVVMLTPKVFGDERGFFMESYNQQAFEDATGCKRNFVQDNHSRSRQGVLRGIHYQLEQPQGKLVRVVHGSVWDVAVDLRRGSAQFGQWVGVELSAENNRQLWVPEGFGHAFVVMSETADSSIRQPISTTRNLSAAFGLTTRNWVSNGPSCRYHLRSLKKIRRAVPSQQRMYTASHNRHR